MDTTETSTQEQFAPIPEPVIMLNAQASIFCIPQAVGLHF
jgi:hypothetical protein